MVLGLMLWSGTIAAQGVPAGRLAALLEEGDSAWVREDHPAAFTAYDAVVRADSSYSTRALFRVGVMHSWAGRHTAAVACQRLYVRLEPADLEGRVALGRTFAWASRFRESLAQFDTVLAREDDYRDALLGRATTLAWWGRIPDAVRALERWQETHPADGEAALIRARFLSWAGRLDEAFALYDSLAEHGGELEASKGRARVLAWRGDLGSAEERWRAIVSDYPADVEARVGHAQVLRWMGRSFAAADALKQALAIDPGNSDAREQLRWVEAEIRPASWFNVVGANDSERNTLIQLDVNGAMVTRGSLRVAGTVRTKAVAAGLAGSATGTNTAVGALQWQPAGRALTLRGELGAVLFSRPIGPTESSAKARGALRAHGRLGPRLSFGGGVGIEPFDDVVSMVQRRMMFSGADVDVGYAVHSRVSLALAGSVGVADGDLIRDERRTALAAARWTVTRAVQLAVTHREVAWDEPAYGIFFAPQRFALTEVSARWERPRDLGLMASAEVGMGAQRIRFETDPLTSSNAPRLAARLGWRPRPGREIVGGAVYAFVAGAGTISATEYRYGAVTLTGRWTF